MWSSVVHSTINSDVVPKSRSKHAVCLGVTVVDDELQPKKPALFLLGGRMSNVALRDFWVLDLESGLWTLLSGNGKDKTNGKTPNVQEHSMIFWNNRLYVFGGTFTQNGECPLWIFDIQKNTWTQWLCPKEKDAPQCRKAHTAVIWQNQMLIYGGYQDFKGSLNELWIFAFDSKEWKMIGGNQSKRGEILPPPRHSHSAVIYKNEMFIYGGMTNLISRSDFWKYDLIGKTWEQIKLTKNAKINPGSLHGHSAVIFKSNKNDAMLLIGGERPDGSLSDQVWSYNFSTEIWERMEIQQPKPSARTQLTALTLNTPFFTLKSECKSLTAERVNVQNSSVITNTDSEDSMIKKISSFVSTQGTIKTRPYLPTSFTLARNPVYHLVSRNESVGLDLSPPASRFLKSRYSLLSNASNDSLAFEEMNAEDNLPNMIRSEDKVHLFHRSVKFRSESVHDFVTPATRCVVPRSQTTARFNPFDPTKVRRDETFDITTSDYASEMDESFASSFIGIPNPVYDDFVISNVIPFENRDEEHRNFALALNDSLETKKYRGERYMQLRKLLSSNEQTDFGEQLQVLGVPNVLSSIENENHLPFPSRDLCDSVLLDNKDWCILSIGGRESESKSNMFPFMPLSIWMLQIN